MDYYGIIILKLINKIYHIPSESYNNLAINGSKNFITILIIKMNIIPDNNI